MKQAALALIFNNKHQVLSVSRRDNHEDKGLPGGKREGDETLEEALIREIYEETGLRVISYSPVFVAFDGEYECTTYLCEVTGEISPHDEKDGKPQGKVEFVEWEYLMTKGSFTYYNTKLYKHLHQ